jgi:hypothetical protein
MDEIDVAGVMPRVAMLLPAVEPAGAGIRTLDLRSGRFRYEVTAAVTADAAVLPATKPLAQAH